LTIYFFLMYEHLIVLKKSVQLMLQIRDVEKHFFESVFFIKKSL
jgi:hypothetical protein